MAVKKGLGRGLDALIRPAVNKSAVSTEEKKENQRNNSKPAGKIQDNEKETAEKKSEKKTGTKSKSEKQTRPQDDQNSEESVNVNIEETPQNEELNTAKKSSAEENKPDESQRPERVVKITSVEPNRTQPRKNFDEDSLMELAESIKQYGILQPLLVSDKKDYYEIIAGERRWRAAKLAGLKEVPVIVKELNDQERVEISLIENIQREDLNPIEEAQAFKRLIDEFSLKQDEIAERVSKSRTAVTNSMRLLKLDEKVQQMLIDDMISAGHARALLALPLNEQQAEIAMKIFDEKLSVRETERLIKNILTPPKKTERVIVRDFTQDAIFENLEEKMKGILGTKVNINRKRNNKGKIEIEYYSMEELERITDLLNTIG